MSGAVGPQDTYTYNGVVPATIYVEDPTPLTSATVGNTTANATAGADVGHTYFEIFTTITIVSFDVISRTNTSSSANFSLQDETGSTTFWGPLNYAADNGIQSTIPVNVSIPAGRYRFFTSDKNKCLRFNTDDDGGRDVNGIIDVLGELNGTKGGNFFDIVIEIPDPCGIRAYTITENCSAPISLLSFYGEEKGNSIKLNWEVASELNNDYYFVQRSNDGVNFTTIGTVKGRGTTNEYGNFNYTDYSPLSLVNYYRIAQVDFDGTTTYTHIINFKSGEINISMSPNPFSESTTVAISDLNEVKVEVIDLLGRVVEEKIKPFGSQAVAVGSSLNPGNYFIRIILDGQVTVYKIVKE